MLYSSSMFTPLQLRPYLHSHLGPFSGFEHISHKVTMQFGEKKKKKRHIQDLKSCSNFSETTIEDKTHVIKDSTQRYFG